MSSDENIIATPADNSMACEAISAKLIEVSHVAESLDGILHDTQDGLNIFESSVAAASSVDRKATNNSDVRCDFITVMISINDEIYISILGLEL